MLIKSIVYNDAPIRYLHIYNNIDSHERDNFFIYLDGDLVYSSDRLIVVNGETFTFNRFYEYVVKYRQKIENLVYLLKSSDKSCSMDEHIHIVVPRDIDCRFRQCICISEVEDITNSYYMEASQVLLEMCDTFSVVQENDFEYLIDLLYPYRDFKTVKFYCPRRYIKVEVVDKKLFDYLIAKNKFLKG